MLKDKRLFLLDMDGTIYLDDDLFDGTVEFLQFVKEIGGKYLFLTNNSSKSAKAYVEKMNGVDAYWVLHDGSVQYTVGMEKLLRSLGASAND